MVGTLVRKVSKLVVAPAGVVTRRRQNDLVVLLYHRVGNGPGEIHLPAATFEAHLRHLAANERILPLDHALGSGEGGVVLTFDDGTPDFVDTVVPLLVAYGVPATLYLATALANGGPGLTWSALHDAVDTGLVTVGSHTHSHADLRRLDERACEDELRRSKDLIEDRLGVACRHFAYPWAVGSPIADRLVRRRFDSAALRAWRTNRHDRIDPYRLGRTPVLRSDGSAFFPAKARGLLDAEAVLYRLARRGPWGRS